MSTENEIYDLDDDTKKELVSILTCSLCHGIYRNPFTVNDCMHSFCEACIVKDAKNTPSNENVRCPKCLNVIGTKSTYKNGLTENKILLNLINVMFPKFIELNDDNRQKLYEGCHNLKKSLPGMEQVLIEKDEKVTIELIPMKNTPFQDMILPPVEPPFVKVKESCEIDAIKKYIKNQLVKGPQNCKIEDYNDIVLNFKGLDQNGKTRIKQIKTVYDCKENKIELYYYKKH